MVSCFPAACRWALSMEVAASSALQSSCSVRGFASPGTSMAKLILAVSRRSSDAVFRRAEKAVSKAQSWSLEWG